MALPCIYGCILLLYPVRRVASPTPGRITPSGYCKPKHAQTAIVRILSLMSAVGRASAAVSLAVLGWVRHRRRRRAGIRRAGCWRRRWRWLAAAATIVGGENARPAAACWARLDTEAAAITSTGLRGDGVRCTGAGTSRVREGHMARRRCGGRGADEQPWQTEGESKAEADGHGEGGMEAGWQPQRRCGPRAMERCEAEEGDGVLWRRRGGL